MTIESYQYKAGDYSPIDNLLNPFWTWVVELLPMWMAPNLVTLIGLATLVISYSTMLYHDMTMTQPLPQWTYAFVAFGIFAFQTLDAIDGKQARRTGSSSPLGQLFDHGCDAISWTVTNLTVISFLGLGVSFNSVLSIYASIGPYFFTNLLEYYSGVYVFNIGIIDSTTGQMVLIFFTLLPAIFGGDFYFWKLEETFPFLPSFMTDGILNKNVAMIVVVYVGVIYSV